MRPKTIAILGAGNGGQCAAADLALAGFDVNLFQLPRFRAEFEPIERTRTIVVEGVGRTGTARLKMATCNLADALDGTDLILVIVPAFGHASMARLAAPHLRDGQIVVLLPGNGGTLEWHTIMRSEGVRADILLAETCTLPYGVRAVRPGLVHKFIDAAMLPTGVFPSGQAGKVIPQLQILYPTVTPCRDVLEAAINNANPIVHPAATLLNVGRIEYSRGDFYLYREGMTPAVARVYERLNEERLAICDRLGWKLYHWDGLDFKGYGLGENLEEMKDTILKTSMDAAFGDDSIDAGMQMIGPRSMEDRFVTEDVPYGLTLTAQIGDLVGVPTPTTKAIIHLCSVINRTDYWAGGRGLRELGIEGLDAETLPTYLREGRR